MPGACPRSLLPLAAAAVLLAAGHAPAQVGPGALVSCLEHGFSTEIGHPAETGLAFGHADLLMRAGPVARPGPEGVACFEPKSLDLGVDAVLPEADGPDRSCSAQPRSGCWARAAADRARPRGAPPQIAPGLGSRRPPTGT